MLHKSNKIDQQNIIPDLSESINDLNGKKIWIKQAHEDLYCVNGCFIIGCLEGMTLSDIAGMLDWMYSPAFYGKHGKEYAYHVSDGVNGTKIGGVFNLRTLNDDTLCKVRDVESDYIAWSSGRDDIYLNDTRNVSEDEWYEDNLVPIDE